MTDLAEYLSEALPPRDPIRTEMVRIIRAKADSHPRHLQVELGPSEVGTPCMRKLAYGMMNVPRCNPEWDPLPSIMGIAGHNWMQEAFEWANEQLGRKRWLTETRVTIRPDLWGSCDLFDVDTGTVIDYKFLGVTSFVAKIKDPGITYRRQVQLYGRGFQKLGYDVKHVAIAIFPRAGTLSKMQLKREAYSDAVVDDVLAKRDAVIQLCDDFKVEIDPDRYHWIPATPDQCVFCPQWSPNPRSGIQCSGDTK